MEESFELHPPFKLAVGNTECYNCGAEFPVVAVLGIYVEDGHSEAAILSYIEDFAEALLVHTKRLVEVFEKIHSQTAGFDYYANICPHCGFFAGDHHLYSVDGVFFPIDADQVATLRIVDVPLAEPMRFVATVGTTSWVRNVLD